MKLVNIFSPQLKCDSELECEHHSIFVSHRKKYKMVREMYPHDGMSE